MDLSTKSEAGKAFEALAHSTHLYGRRLVSPPATPPPLIKRLHLGGACEVLEWSKDDETLEDVRKRTSEHFHTGGLGALFVSRVGCPTCCWAQGKIGQNEARRSANFGKPWRLRRMDDAFYVSSFNAIRVPGGEPVEHDNTTS